VNTSIFEKLQDVCHILNEHSVEYLTIGGAAEHGRCFVHGGFNRFLPFTGQLPSTYYWDRGLWLAALDWQTTGRPQTSITLIPAQGRVAN